MQQSTRDPRVPTDEALKIQVDRTDKDLHVDDYRPQLMERMAEAWSLAWANIQRVQCSQKSKHDPKMNP